MVCSIDLVAEIALSGRRLIHDLRAAGSILGPAEGVSECFEGEQGTFLQLKLLVLAKKQVGIVA